MNRYIFIILIFFLGCKPDQESSEADILEVLEMQTKCWNKADINCFMESYWKSDSLVFVGSRGLTYGWQSTLDNYIKSYPNSEAMGTLDFDILKVERISHDSYFVIGQWHLARTIGDLGGHFSLLWKFIDGRWVIVADHSS